MRLLQINDTDVDIAQTETQVTFSPNYTHFTFKLLIAYLQVKFYRWKKNESKYHLLMNIAFGHPLHENKTRIEAMCLVTWAKKPDPKIQECPNLSSGSN